MSRVPRGWDKYQFHAPVVLIVFCLILLASLLRLILSQELVKHIAPIVVHHQNTHEEAKLNSNSLQLY